MSAMASTSSSSWSIAIKTVGSRITANKAATNNNINILHNSSHNHHDNNDDNGGGGSSQNYTSHSSSSTGESTSFTLQVHPNDPIHSLSTKIESITGLSPTEQRLIYRGRIISVPPPPPTNDNHNVETTTTSSSSTTIQDIHGLSDGETIHLVPRLAVENNAIPILPRRDSSSISSTNAIAANNNFGRRNSSNTTNNDNNTEAEEADGIANAIMGGLLSGFNGNYPTEDIVGSGGLFSGANGGGGGANNVTSLSGSDGMSLLAALLGLGSAVDGSGSGGTANNDNNNQQQQQQRQGAGVAGNAQGLGGVVSRAAMMGVLDDGSSTTTTNMTTTTAAAAVPASSLDSLVAAAVRAAATGGGPETTTAQPRTTAGLFNRSADEIRSSRNAATANPFNPNNNNNANTATTTATGAPSSSSAIRAARNRRRATAARLTASDIRIPDPGSMEPVRQGLMTLHTLLGNAELGLNEQRQRQQRIQQHRQEVDGEEKGEEELTDNFGGQSQPRNQLDHHPLNSHRQWYRGQWLDALDTVNQWLEATIVDIVLPSDLLGNWAVSRSSHDGMRQRRTMYHNNTSQQQQRPVEAVVSGNDLEGRRRLLLEPRPSDEDDDNNVMSYLNEGFRPRDDNDGVQLLLIHYNGWPHRWDEWIRSDSPRIRPFRTRTRHRIMSTHASPTPQAVFQAAPSTFIRDESDEVERAMLLPELQRVIASVNDVLSSVLPLEEEGEGRTGMTSSSSSSSLENDSSSAVDSSHLPWRLPNHGSEYFQSAAANNDDDDNGNSDDNSDDGYYNNSTSSSRRQRPDPRSQLNAAQLRQLAPLIDRLGRTLTDAAPHIASLADTLPRHPSPLPQARPVPRTDQVGDGSESFAAQASRLYFGINSEDDHDGRSESASSTATADAQVAEVETPVDPDLTDFVNGMVNTTRGGSSRDTNREPISSNLLASYLSSIGAGGGALTAGGGDNNDAPRVVRVGGGDGALFGAGGGAGPGIDIHIHAIVTGPGMTPTGLGGLGIGGGGTPVNRNANVSAPVTATPVQQQSSGGGIDGDEIDHLFSDLYSESPPPVNLHQNHRNNDAISGNRDNLSQIFEECRSIEEESDSSIDSAATQPFDGKVVASTHEDVVSAVEEGAISADSEVVNESNDASNDSTTVGTASSPDTRPPPPAADRRRSSSSFGSRMYRRTFGRLNGSSRRFSGS
mmetsp:Transcript_642/g.1035  ORF Transcript_642/g.1035 Transcript_642/m.1035 type:complete len:1191 (-) Transcript_642:65-3637(-)